MYRISNVNGKGKTSSIAVDLDSKRQFLLQAIIDANDWLSKRHTIAVQKPPLLKHLKLPIILSRLRAAGVPQMSCLRQILYGIGTDVSPYANWLQYCKYFTQKKTYLVDV